MKTCKKCGANCPDEMEFCNVCGEKLGAATEDKPVNLIDATKTFFMKSIEFSGRTSKAEFWWGYLGAIIVSMVLSITIILSPVSFLICIPAFAAMFRRLHDTGKPGWWAFVPVAGLIFCIADGEDGANQYGEKPAK